MISLLSPGLIQREYFRLPFTFINTAAPYLLPVSATSYARGFLYIPVFMYAYNSGDDVVAQLRYIDNNVGIDLSYPVDLYSTENASMYPTSNPASNLPLSITGIEILHSSAGSMTTGGLQGWMYYTLIPLPSVL